ncbi:DUF1168-domain-containing protein [Melanogaster broomeanus]|nr:DUF1168-domain-containing protein [Melanogaster broomeanus]
MSTSNSPAPNSHSASPAPGPATRHALTPLERQRSQLDRLFKDPSKPAYVPPPPQEKAIRPAREMMKNVQGSSAGAGSGEFHVYKASRRREYERLKMMEEQSRKETEVAEFEQKRKAAESLADAKTAKNRAKRQKKKERTKVKPSEKASTHHGGGQVEAPLKKRRLVNGKELVFKRQGEESDEDDDEKEEEEGNAEFRSADGDEPRPQVEAEEAARIAAGQRITIHEDD